MSEVAISTSAEEEINELHPPKSPPSAISFSSLNMVFIIVTLI